jgi:hypothetical protein
LKGGERATDDRLIIGVRHEPGQVPITRVGEMGNFTAARLPAELLT